MIGRSPQWGSMVFQRQMLGEGEFDIFTLTNSILTPRSVVTLSYQQLAFQFQGVRNIKDKQLRDESKITHL